ncbi:MAG: acetate kinase, partial [Burkholderiales bacterium]|nr:acetate kinase [Burkholderiales bacterium]
MKPGSKNTDVILSVNSGSSTIKFALYPVVERQVDPAILSGFVEGLEPGGDTQICFKSDQFNQQFSLQNAHLSDEEKFDQSLVRLRSLLQEHSDGMNVIAVAHRIVHGGDVYSASVVVDENALRYLHTLDSLAPLHQPHNLKGVEAFRRAYPQVPQIACFDTGFHAEMPEVETTLALPEVIRKNGIRRYGFHGLSYRYVAGKLMQNSSRASQKVIMAHLGNGAS